MKEDVHNFILELLERKSPLPKDFDDNSDFIDAGIIDSIQIIKFVLDLEAKFGVEITDDEIVSQDFRNVRGLTNLIYSKIK